MRLDGTTPSAERADIIQSFAAPDVPVMLLSVHAGGVGLNLQVADTVIMFDTGKPHSFLHGLPSEPDCCLYALQSGADMLGIWWHMCAGMLAIHA